MTEPFQWPKNPVQKQDKPWKYESEYHYGYQEGWEAAQDEDRMAIEKHLGCSIEESTEMVENWRGYTQSEWYR